MYDQSITQIQLTLAFTRLKLPIKRRTLSEITWWTKHLDSLLNDDGTALKRKLTQQEIDFIRSERAMCKWDALYFITRYIWLVGISGFLVRMALTIAQKVIWDHLCELERKGVAKNILILKARQGGVSTFFLVLALHLYIFFGGRRGLIASSAPGKTAKLCDKLDGMLTMIPWWLKPQFEIFAINEQKMGVFAWVEEHKNEIIAAAGNQKTATARGDTLQMAHVTELDEWLNPKEDIQAALMEAIHDFPLNLFVIEGTGGSKGTWWHEQYVSRKELDLQGRSRFHTMFLPWYLFTDIHPTDAWLRANPIPKDWQPSTITIEQAQKAKAYVQLDTRIRKYLGEDWEMPRKQMWWYEFSYEEAKRSHTLFKFMCETASDDISCFQNDSQSAFEQELVFELRATQKEPDGVYGIWNMDGLISSVFKPPKNDIDPNRQPIRILSHWNKAQKPYEFWLIPLKWKGQSSDDPHGNKLLVWHPPQDGFYYGIGGDFSEGKGLDNTAFEVISRSSYTHRAQQCAEFASSLISAKDSWPFLMAIGTWYATKTNGEIRQPRMILEGQTSGDRAAEDLHLRGWRHFHRWHHLALRRMSLENVNRLCWYTNAYSRAWAMEQIITMLRDKEFEVNSPWLVEEIANIERGEAKGKLEAAMGAHDDRFMTSAFTLFSLHYRWTESKQDKQSQEDQMAKLRKEAEKITYEKDYYRLVHGGVQDKLSEMRKRAMGI